MKKFKEFIFLPISVIVILFLFVGMFFMLVPDDAYYSNGEYLKLLLQDEMFLSAMFNTFFIPSLVAIGTSVLGTVVMLLLKYVKKMNITRKHYFITLFVLSIASSFAVFAFFTSALDKTAELNTSVQMGIFAFIFAVIISVFVTYLFWFIELIVILIKKLIKGIINKRKEV